MTIPVMTGDDLYQALDDFRALILSVEAEVSGETPTGLYTVILDTVNNPALASNAAANGIIHVFDHQSGYMKGVIRDWTVRTGTVLSGATIELLGDYATATVAATVVPGDVVRSVNSAHHVARLKAILISIATRINGQPQ